MYYRRMFSFICDLRVIYHVLTLWILVNDFLAHTVYGSKFSWQYILQEYKLLKIQADILNQTIGNNVGLLLLKHLFFFSVYINKLFRLEDTTVDIVRVIIMTFYFIEAFVLLLLSSDITNKVNIST